jgi:DNA-binding MarR family transcriptional regulator
MENRDARISTRVSFVIRGFMRLWAKFGAVLPHELASIRKDLEGVSPDSELLPDTNYEMFYRLTSQIDHDDNITMGQVSDALGVPLSTATRIVDLLVERGYAQRFHDNNDRRVVRVELTDKGRELHAIIEGHIIKRIEQLLSALTKEEREEIFFLIDKIDFIINRVVR